MVVSLWLEDGLGKKKIISIKKQRMIYIDRWNGCIICDYDIFFLFFISIFIFVPSFSNENNAK